MTESGRTDEFTPTQPGRCSGTGARDGGEASVEKQIGPYSMESISRWFSVTKSVAVVTLATTAILGIGGAAHATTLPGAASHAGPTSSLVQSHAGVDTTRTVGPRATTLQETTGSPGGATRAPSSSPSPAPRAAEPRSAVSSLLNAIKALPGLWSKFSAAVKQAYAAFVPLWNGIKAVVGWIATLVSAWDIWKTFH